jgi:asparagine synthase (glutamine-hydrolysing)
MGSSVNAAELKRMNDLIEHRGPDSFGFYESENIGFGHRRLSILDLSPLGHQPMEFQDKYVITFNGEIYNYIEIKEELKGLGYHFNSNSDTEVILAAYDCWKEKCLSKFNGMWAFALYDKAAQKIFMSRDRFGVKPIYYREDETSFRFGSEIKQLLNEKGGNVVNESALLEGMLTHIDNHKEDTYFKDVFSFPPSHYMYYDLNSNSKVFIRYYELKVNTAKKGKNIENLQAEFDVTLKNAIEIRLRSDVKVGTCLSGGLDSSAISMIASKLYAKDTDQKFVAINAKSIDASNDESSYAELVAKEANLDLNVVMPTYDNFKETIDEVVYTQEEPFGSPSMFMGWHVFQKARALNCTVMLNGQGGDEVLLGYERYFAATLNFWNPIQLIRQLINQYQNSRLSFLSTVLYSVYFRLAEVRIKRLKKKTYIKPEFFQSSYFDAVRKSANTFSNVDDMQIYEITTLQLPHLLRYEDRNSMRHSIETRLPFLDYRLVELGISLPTKVKIKNGWTKFILRKSVEKILPAKIVWRKNKFGFEAPDKIWLNKYNTEMLNEISKSKILAKYCDLVKLQDDFQNISLKDRWMYFNVARWEQIFDVRLN